MEGEAIITGCFGTLSIWINSALIALGFALLLASGVTYKHRILARFCIWTIHLTRGIPTAVLVLAAGIGLIAIMPAFSLPVVFPGTLVQFQPLAWAIVIALALSSAGHLAEIFLAARNTVGRERIEQMRALGLSHRRRISLLCCECAAVAMPAITNRLIHHLHNTAFAALFPVVELFGVIQTHASTTFQIVNAVMIGALAYVVMSSGIWLAGRLIERWLQPPVGSSLLKGSVNYE